MTNDQFVGHAPDITGLTVTAHYSDSTLDHEVDSADLTVTPAEYDEAGAQTITISYTDEYGTAEATQSVTVLAVELSALAVTGDFTDTQYTGSAPTKTGLTFTASYNDGTSDTVSASDINVSPATWDASGNPNNLGSQIATFSYTEDGVTKTATKSVVIHRPNEQTIQGNAESWAYFDYDSSWTSLTNPRNIITDGVSQGDLILGIFEAGDYANDTTIDLTKLMSYLSDFLITNQASGVINTQGYVPGTGTPIHSADNTENYIALSIHAAGQEESPMATSATAKLVVGSAADDIASGVGYKASDFTNIAAEYTCHINVTTP